MLYLSSFRHFGLVLLALGACLAQVPALGQAPDSLPAPARQLQRYSQQTLVEKLYVHLDRPAYAARETMWLNVYAVDGTFHKPLAMSKVAYVEVLNNLHQPVLQTQIALRDATGQGSLKLPASLPTGRYEVRAYTSWMKNFDPEFFFHAPVTIINTFAAAAPTPAATAASYDVQFFPEGGQLVLGLPSRVGFRVVDAASRGLAATGTVRDGQGKAVATLRTVRFGLGSFAFRPTTAGSSYTAELQLATGQRLTYKLPAAAAQGYVLQLTEASPTQLRLRVMTKGAGLDAASLTLVAHSGQRIAAAQVAQLAAQGEVDFLLDKSRLLAGISHLTVFNSRRQPVGERLYFRRPRPLPLAATLSQTQFQPREKVTLRLALPLGAAPATASVAVYQLDSLATSPSPADIGSVLSLTSDLKGTVENPNYYLRDSSQVGQEATDNLMLTHGWSRFRWSEVLADRAPALPYPPELNGPLVQGRVLTAAGAPAPGITAYLAAPSRAARFYTATSQADGTVQFEPRDLYGPHVLTLQTDWRRDSTYQLALLSPYSAHYVTRLLPALALTPGLTPDLTRRHLQVQLQNAYFSRYQQYILPLHDTVAFYGIAPKLYRLDDYTRFKVLEEVLREYVQDVYVRPRKDGMHFLVFDQLHRSMFAGDPLVLLDGVPMFDLTKLMAFDPLRIRQVDVFTNRYFYGSQDYEGMLSFTTYQGDLQGFPLDPRALLEEYEGLQGQREFFAPRYETAQQRQSSLPDQRNLLHWQPAITLAPGTAQQVTFYTPDQVGHYQVVVQALGADGRACTVSSTFKMEVI